MLNKRGESPLYQASCLPNRIDIVELMLSYGANPRIHTNSGSTPLHAACVAGESKYVIALVKNGAIVNTQNPSNGETPLHKACSLAEPEVVRELLLQGPIKVYAIMLVFGHTKLHLDAEKPTKDT